VVNATQESTAPVGQRCVTTAPTESATYRLHGSVGTIGREPKEELQMRNTTFISSMVLSVACVSAANAAVTSIDSFGIVDAISPSGPLNGFAYSAGSNSQAPNYTVSRPYGAATSRDLIGTWRTAGGGTAKGSISVGTSAMTMSYGGTATTTGKWFNTMNTFNPDPLDSNVYYSYQTSIAQWGAFGTDPAVAFASTIDMSGFTSFSFDLSGYQTTGTLNNAKMYLRVLDNNGLLGSYDVALSNGHVDVAAANFGDLDWSAIYGIEMVFTNTMIGNSSSNFLVAGVAPPTGTVTVSNFGYVPAPSALALLGAAGLIGARRRRA